MTRPEKTKLLSNLLENKLRADGAYWSSEVTVDFNTANRKRVDYMSFKPKNQSASGVEKGIFTCYEVKSCVEDYKSGNGLNFFGEKNYIVTDMKTYKKAIHLVDHGVGAYVAVPMGMDVWEYFDDTSELESDVSYELKCLQHAREKDRHYSMNVLLFCMLRSGK